MANPLKPNPLIAVDTNVPLAFQKAMLVLKSFDVEMPVIATPREIVAKFE